MILESSGVGEPRNILRRFECAERDGHPLQAKIRLDNLVTVVDAHSFSRDWVSRMPVISRPDLGEGGALRPVVDLLVEQIECASPVRCTCDSAEVRSRHLTGEAAYAGVPISFC